ncbi:DUF1579 family protein [Gemmatimonas groenlandica]|uniref:DUF1579 family protein n=1 Tax=Gemmatimonas groenlandica TaxID=2732249 RepID=A0A6M4IVQ3_9BACT|nr:DUF1579 family protein [Gemmatimonas groenlandica]QJR37586.1 DUF1579 family protein [Gemmatimonas groenlandica]
MSVHDDTASPVTTAALRRLDAFVGTWQSVGTFYSDDPGEDAPADAPANTGTTGSADRMLATDRYVWLPGGAFLAHHWDAKMPDGRTQGVELIGYEADRQVYSMHAFDSHGSRTTMHATVDADAWTFEGDDLRFTGHFQDDGATFRGRWLRRAGDSATWVPWMELTLTRDASSPDA